MSLRIQSIEQSQICYSENSSLKTIFDNVQNLLDVGQSVLENTVYRTVTDMLQ